MIPNSNFGAEVAAARGPQIYDDIYGPGGAQGGAAGREAPCTGCRRSPPTGLSPPRRATGAPDEPRYPRLHLAPHPQLRPEAPGPCWLGALAKDSPLRKYDWVLLVAVVGLSLIGTLLVYSATQPSADPRRLPESSS